MISQELFCILYEEIKIQLVFETEIVNANRFVPFISNLTNFVMKIVKKETIYRIRDYLVGPLLLLVKFIVKACRNEQLAHIMSHFSKINFAIDSKR